ncbi:unnamed protein product [Urochloa humidicola]
MWCHGSTHNNGNGQGGDQGCKRMMQRRRFTTIIKDGAIRLRCALSMGQVKGKARASSLLPQLESQQAEAIDMHEKDAVHFPPQHAHGSAGRTAAAIVTD